MYKKAAPLKVKPQDEVPYLIDVTNSEEVDMVIKAGAKYNSRENYYYVPVTSGVNTVMLPFLPRMYWTDDYIYSTIGDDCPLTMELVPKTCWFSNVRDHVSNEDWRMISRAVSKRVGHRCEICGSQGSEHPVEAHEMWEYDYENMTQRLKGIVALDSHCHLVKHSGYADLSGQKQLAFDHMLKVNGWSEEYGIQYYNNAVEEWKLRSQFEWELDLSWLFENFPEVELINAERLTENI